MFNKGKNKDEKEKVDVPALTEAHFLEITGLIKKYGGRNKVLAYWHAVTLDDKGNIKAVLDHSQHNEYLMEQYEALEPLKGIKYIGTGHIQYIPYNWCNEWLARWEWWVGENPDHPAVKGLLASPERRASMRASFNKLVNTL